VKRYKLDSWGLRVVAFFVLVIVSASPVFDAHAQYGSGGGFLYPSWANPVAPRPSAPSVRPALGNIYPSQKTIGNDVCELIPKIGQNGYDASQGGPLRIIKQCYLWTNAPSDGFVSLDNRRLTGCEITGRQPVVELVDPNALIPSEQICPGPNGELPPIKFDQPSKAKWIAAGFPENEFKKFDPSKGISMRDLLRCRIACNGRIPSDFAGDVMLPTVGGKSLPRWSGCKQLTYPTYSNLPLVGTSFGMGCANGAMRDLGAPDWVLYGANGAPLVLQGTTLYANGAKLAPQQLCNLKGGLASMGGGFVGGQVANYLGACPEQQEAAAVFSGWGCSFAGGPHVGVGTGVCTIISLGGEGVYQTGKGLWYGGLDYPGTLCSTIYQGGFRGFFKCYLGE